MKKKRVSERAVWSGTANIVLIILCLLAVLPFVLLVIGSFTDNQVAMTEGFSFSPSGYSLDAYRYIARQWDTIGRAYVMTVVVTLVGTGLSMMITSMFAYAMAQKNLPGRKILMFMCIFTMLFNGGVVATYYVYTSVIPVKNTIWGLIMPYLLMSPFNVILVRNYFLNSVSPSIVEAARIDGANEFKIFGKVVLPLSAPIMATIGLMTAIAYWNDWTNGLYFLSERDGGKYYTIQLVLNSINNNINFLANSSSLTAATQVSLPSTTMRMAIAVVGILPIIVAYPFFQKYFVKGISLGGVKE